MVLRILKCHHVQWQHTHITYSSRLPAAVGMRLVACLPAVGKLKLVLPRLQAQLVLLVNTYVST